MPLEVAYWCENCSRKIWSIGKAFVWQSHVVCYPCYQALHTPDGKLLSRQMISRKSRHFLMGLAVSLPCFFSGGISGWYLHAATVPTAVVQHASPPAADATTRPVSPQ